jgi:hypothetical protein
MTGVMHGFFVRASPQARARLRAEGQAAAVTIADEQIHGRNHVADVGTMVIIVRS